MMSYSLTILKKVQTLVKSKLSYLGINKKQEIIRLLFEISKRDTLSPESIIQDADLSDFNKLKHYLLKRRFPHAYLTNEISRPCLPKIKLNHRAVLKHDRSRFYPRKIFIEEKAQSSYLAGRFKKFFPESKFSGIKSLKDYLKKNRRFTIEDYNRRTDSVFITYENFDFFKKCPCTKKAVRCGYHIFNLSFGCIYDCSYCYLQEYTNSPGLIFPANIDKFFQVFDSYKSPRMRIGTGEFSDSLMLDHITEYSLPLLDFFRRHPKVDFEFKTKSKNISNLLKIRPSGNITVSWSLNPQRIIDENEFFTPSLAERLKAAGICADAGYKIGIHFDPVIFFKGWEKEYREVIELLFASIRPRDIAWISMGTLRFNPKVKQVIETRFPENKILDEELAAGFDNKLRYPYSIRREIYALILQMISMHSRKIPVYLCMEGPSMWHDSKLNRGYCQLSYNHKIFIVDR